MSPKQAIPPKAPSKTETPSPLDLAAESFYLSREAMRCTEATLIWYHKYVGALVEHLTGLGINDVMGITPDHLRVFLVQLQRRGLADRTIHHHASAAKAFSYTALTATDEIFSR